MTTLYTTNFPETAGTDLATVANWATRSGNGTDKIVISPTGFARLGTGSIYPTDYVSISAATTEYTVSATFEVATNGDSDFFLTSHAGATDRTGYEFLYNGSSISLTRYAAGTGSLGQLVPIVLSVGASYTASIQTTISGSNLVVTVKLIRLSDGFYLTSSGTWQSGAAIAITITDTSPLAIGYGAIGFIILGSSGDATGIQVNNFDLDAPATTVADPTFSVAAGTYTVQKMVTVSTTTSDATIRVTTDGTTPSETVGTIVVAGCPIPIAASMTLKAIAYKSGLADSNVVSSAYTLNLNPVTYSHLADPTVVGIFDDRTPPSGTVGSAMTGWTNGSTSGVTGLDITTGFGSGLTVATDGTYTFLHNNGTSYCRIPNSAALDFYLANQLKNAGGNTILVVVDLDGTSQGWLVNKGSTGTTLIGDTGPNNLAFLSPQSSGSAAPVWCAWNTLYVERPYTGGPASVAIRNNSNTYDAASSFAYSGDGQLLYYNGAMCRSNGIGTLLDLTADNGHDLVFGGVGGGDNTGFAVAGKIRAVVIWGRAANHHEILAAHRYYANRYGFPETLTNQRFALVVDSNSESTKMTYCGSPVGTYNGEVGLYDRVSVSLGISTNACFMLGRASQSTMLIINKFNAEVKPLILYLQSLGMHVALHMWEGVNDNFVASHYVDYFNLLAGLNVRYSTSTCFARGGVGGSRPGDSTIISAFNAQVIADGVTFSYPVGLVGNDATLGEAGHADGTWNTVVFDDTTHWNTAGIVIGEPYFVTPIAASVADLYSFSILLMGSTEG